MNSDAGFFAHDLALVESSNIGAGTRVWAFAHVMEGASVGSGCNIGGGSFVESGAVVGNGVTVKNNSLIWHGVTLEDEVFVGPNTVFTNDMSPRAHRPSSPDEWLPTLVRKGASIGANSTIVCGVTIGENSLIGAGSVVIDDVPAHALVVGNPAREVGWVCYCGHRLPSSLECPSCGRVFSQADGVVAEVAT